MSTPPTSLPGSCPGSPSSSGSLSPLSTTSAPPSPQSLSPPRCEQLRHESPATRKRSLSEKFSEFSKKLSEYAAQIAEKQMTVTEAQTGLVTKNHDLEVYILHEIDLVQRKLEIVQEEYIEALKKGTSGDLGLVRDMYEATKNKLEELKCKHESVLEELDQTRSQLASSQTAVTGTLKQLDEKTKELEAKEKELKEAIEKVTVLTAAVNELQQADVTFSENFEKLKTANDNQTILLQAKDAKIKNLEEQLKNRAEELASKERQFRTFEDKHSQAVDALNKTIQDLRMGSTVTPPLKSEALKPPQMSTMKKVIFIAFAILIVIALGVAVYFLLPKLIALGASASAALWRAISTFVAKAPSVPVINPALYALRGRLGV